jgi:prepilin-type N-terminal cleavage/methylation domain-containing protein
MKKKNYKCLWQNNDAGFTFIEIILVVGILAVVMAAVYKVSVFGYKEQLFLQEQNHAVEQAKAGIETMVKEIREAADGDDGSYPLVLAQDFELIVFSDVDVDQVTERIRYFLDGNQFKKEVVEPEGPPFVYNPDNSDTKEVFLLSSYVTNELRTTPIFRYYNKDYPGNQDNNPLSTPADLQAVVLVEVKLLVNITPERAPSDEELSSFVQIRNLKSNL